MSYDGYIYLQVAEKPPPPPDGVDPYDYWEEQPPYEVLLDEVGNYTSNVSRMWSAALGAVAPEHAPELVPAEGSRILLSDTEGWTCAKAAPLLRAAAGWLAEHEEQMLLLNPSNGWGDYAGAVEYLTRAASLAERFATVRSDHGQAYLHWSA